ncbi:hypothetical protein [Acinetobacter sp. XS-4]|uniref:hypothetical protein n=1 Tax=Acinetobacter sp. XS-4 TaxID=2923375 RepID=UPI00208FDF87|nr:hypothetical protein [Acinetobacter sp. XS-4]USP39528.1 hypothetical protein MMY79_13985 [Acinetobacter sp. XS-4]
MTQTKSRYWIFILFTIFYFFILYKFFGITPVKVKALPANEIGDFLAGAFSPLAFLFLILGYLQNTKALQMQSQELKASTDALHQQAQELANNVEEQRKLLSVTQQELEIKHFEARPHLIFYSYPFTLTEKDFPECDDHGSIIDMERHEVAEIKIIIENKGEVAKHVTIEELDSDFNDFNIERYELVAQQKTSLNIEFIGERLELLKSNFQQDIKLKIIYHDKYGRQFSDLMDVYIFVLRDASGSFGVSIKRNTSLFK